MIQLDFKNESDKTAIIFAAMFGHEDIVQILLKNKADMQAK